MSFIQLSTPEQLNPEFVSYATDMNNLQQEHDYHQAERNKLRMLMIGRSEEVKAQYKRNTAEYRYIQEGYRGNQWSQDIIDNNRKAYQEYQRLNQLGVPEYKQLAEVASPTQLMVLAKGEGTTLAHDAYQHLKKTGKLPSKGKMEQRLKGYTNQQFENRTGTVNSNLNVIKVDNTPATPGQPYTAPPQLSEDELVLQRLGIESGKEREHILSLVSNTNLKHITTPRDAYFWYKFGGGTMQELLAIIKQKLSQDKRFELEIREALAHQMAIDVAATCGGMESVVSSPNEPVTFDNTVHAGVRWRR